jgi:type VI secretion system protein ImpM
MTAAVVGIYGKTRAQGDFVRAGVGEFSRAGLDRWLEEAVGVLKTEHAELPQEATGFVFAPADAAAAFVGAFAPSEDVVGRRFPLAVFLEIPAAAAADAWPMIPRSWAPFMRAAGELAVTGRDLVADVLLSRARSLCGEIPLSALEGAQGGRLSHEASLPLKTALGGSPAALAYAFRTFCLALDQAPRAAGASVTLDAPAPSAATREMWLELAWRRGRRRGASVPAAALWTDGADGRLLLATGAPAPAMLAFLANPRHRSQRLWPLRTDVAGATAQAIAALTPAQRRSVEDPLVSLDQLLAEFT